MNGPIVKKLSDAQLKVLRGGCKKGKHHHKSHRHVTRHHRCHRPNASGDRLPGEAISETDAG